MKQKTFNIVAGSLFAFIAIVHALRIAFAWSAAIGGAIIPSWVSWFAFFLAAYLGITAYKLNRR